MLHSKSHLNSLRDTQGLLRLTYTQGQTLTEQVYIVPASKPFSIYDVRDAPDPSLEHGGIPAGDTTLCTTATQPGRPEPTGSRARPSKRSHRSTPPPPRGSPASPCHPSLASVETDCYPPAFRAATPGALVSPPSSSRPACGAGRSMIHHTKSQKSVSVMEYFNP